MILGVVNLQNSSARFMQLEATFYDPWSVDRADGLRLLETQRICIPVKPPEVADRLPTHGLFGLRRNEVPHPS
jgi:hypothetical protein